MRRVLTTLAAAGLAAGALTACGDDSNNDSTRPAKIGVILPDSASSNRWETADRKYLEAAFKAAGVEYDIQNAQGDKTAFQTIADQQITNGATVLMIVNLDSGTGKAVLDKAKNQASRPSTTTGSRWAARPSTTSVSTTCRSASSRARGCRSA